MYPPQVVPPDALPIMTSLAYTGVMTKQYHPHPWGVLYHSFAPDGGIELCIDNPGPSLIILRFRPNGTWSLIGHDAVKLSDPATQAAIKVAAAYMIGAITGTWT